MYEMNRPGLQGHQCAAEYHEQLIKDYQGNPLIEALPPIYEPEQIVSLLEDFPDYSNDQRKWPIHTRMHCVQQIKRFMQPLTYNVVLESSISRVIRDGYTVRNPLTPQFNRQFSIGFSSILQAGLNQEGANITGIRPSASGFAVIGMSGVGKSTSVERTLLLYPQVIQHVEYKGHPFVLKQLVWLKLECPGNGSMKGLCQAFLSQVDSVLGTNYYQHHVKSNSNTENLIIAMSQIAALHGLGVLVIDEIQRLRKVQSNGANIMLEYFTELVNTIGIPVVVIGTYKAMSLFQSAFAEARRVTGQGDQILSNLKEDSEEWKFFLESLWEFQWTRHACSLTDELRTVMYDESQGILDLAAKLYMNVQWQAMVDGTEEVTVDLVSNVARSCLKLLRPMLKGLSCGDTIVLEKYEDLKPDWLQLNDVIKKSNGVQVLGTATVEHARALRQKQSGGIVPSLVGIASNLGMPPEDAEKLVKKVMDACGEMGDPKLLAQQVAEIALKSVGRLNQESTNIETVDKQLSGKKLPKPLMDPDDAWFKVYEALNRKESVYQALVDSTLLKAPCQDLLANG